MAEKVLPEISRGRMMEKDRPAFHKHVCPPNEGGMDNPDPLEPDVFVERDLMVNLPLVIFGPDGEEDEIEIWIIEAPNPETDPDVGPDEERRVFPSRTLRLPQFALVHAEVGAMTNTHTIHWHGLEPTPMNDGVGKHSFEISGHFTYQFQPREAGTFFYHCHKNTPLHFEMGMYGMLIIDPPPPGSKEFVVYQTGGSGWAKVSSSVPGTTGNDMLHYDKEVFWVGDEFDSRWHDPLNHSAFMQKCDENDPIDPENFTQDGILNDFRPDIFLVSGYPRKKSDTRPITRNEPRPPTAPPISLAAPTVKLGDIIYARVLNAGYMIHEYRIHGIDSWLVAGDGYPFGAGKFGGYSRPIPVPAGTPLVLTAARRYDFVIKAAKRGVFPVTIDFIHTITKKHLYQIKTFIYVE